MCKVAHRITFGNFPGMVPASVIRFQLLVDNAFELELRANLEWLGVLVDDTSEQGLGAYFARCYVETYDRRSPAPEQVRSLAEHGKDL
jgi:hypothetical protein